MFSVNSFKHKPAGYYHLTLSITNPEKLLALFRGNFLLIVVIDFDVVAQRMKEQDFELNLTGDHVWPWEVRSSSGQALFKVSNHFISRVAAEFLSLKWLIDELVYTGRMPLQAG